MEKERMKQMVLNIHERQEEEDYQGMASLIPLPPTNHHPNITITVDWTLKINYLSALLLASPRFKHGLVVTCACLLYLALSRVTLLAREDCAHVAAVLQMVPLRAVMAERRCEQSVDRL